MPRKHAATLYAPIFAKRLETFAYSSPIIGFGDFVHEISVQNRVYDFKGSPTDLPVFIAKYLIVYSIVYAAQFLCVCRAAYVLSYGFRGDSTIPPLALNAACGF